MGHGRLFIPSMGQVKSTVSLFISRVMFMFLIWKTDRRIGTVPCSQMSTSVKVGGSVGNQIRHISWIFAPPPPAKVKKDDDGKSSVVMPDGPQCCRKASIARLEPIDFVHPMSKITYSGFDIKLIPSAALGNDQRQSGTSVVGNADSVAK